MIAVPAMSPGPSMAGAVSVPEGCGSVGAEEEVSTVLALVCGPFSFGGGAPSSAITVSVCAGGAVAGEEVGPGFAASPILWPDRPCA